LMRTTTIRFPWESRWAYTTRVDYERGALDDATEIWNTHYQNDKYYGKRMYDAYNWIVENGPSELIGIPLYQSLVLGDDYIHTNSKDPKDFLKHATLSGVLSEREDGKPCVYGQ